MCLEKSDLRSYEHSLYKMSNFRSIDVGVEFLEDCSPIISNDAFLVVS